ncbi:hypothetical protein CYMTET_22561 [Cymbomonas tetramitiformis]|uniref:Uncharacterized protein n=1 Tax=Cymbomonas tetramitiformis TaxID=36881 RepID=A0AAE0L230_9CHLO|nr:hypothetical protein CYMTET_22561 [Cymbomonas tetramitiformis]
MSHSRVDALLRRLFTDVQNVLSNAKDAHHHAYVTAYTEIDGDTCFREPTANRLATRVLIARCDGGFETVSDSTLRDLYSVVGNGAHSNNFKTSGDAFLIFGADAQIWVRNGGLKMPSTYRKIKMSRPATQGSPATTLENTLRNVVDDVLRADDVFLRARGAVLFPIAIARHLSKSTGEETVERRVVAKRDAKGVRVTVSNLAMCSLGALTQAARIASETTRGTGASFSVNLRNRTACYRFNFTDRATVLTKRSSSDGAGDTNGTSDILKRQRTRDGVADEDTDA